MQMTQKIFPCLLIALNICAALSYAADWDVRRAIYWLAAAALTATVTF
jgi:hypothetical protein